MEIFKPVTFFRNSSRGSSAHWQTFESAGFFGAVGKRIYYAVWEVFLPIIICCKYFIFERE